VFLENLWCSSRAQAERRVLIIGSAELSCCLKSSQNLLDSLDRMGNRGICLEACKVSGMDVR